MTSRGYRILTLSSKGEPAARPTVHTGSGYDNTVVTMETRRVLKYNRHGAHPTSGVNRVWSGYVYTVICNVKKKKKTMVVSDKFK